MFFTLFSIFLMSKWFPTCQLLLWRKWLQSMSVMPLCWLQRRLRFVWRSVIARLQGKVCFVVIVWNFYERIPRGVNAFYLLSQEKNKAGDILGDTEKTTTDKKRERRKKKKLKRLKIQEREKRQKLKEAARGGVDDGKKKKSKAEVEQTIMKLTKGGKAKVLTVSGECPSGRLLYCFFLFLNCLSVLSTERRDGQSLAFLSGLLLSTTGPSPKSSQGLKGPDGEEEEETKRDFCKQAQAVML